MVRVFLKFDDKVLANGFAAALSSCGVEIVQSKKDATCVLEDMGNRFRICSLIDDSLIEVLGKPVDFRDVVNVLNRFGANEKLWDGCPFVVNFSTGIMCGWGDKVMKLTDLQQKLFRVLMSSAVDGGDFDDLCLFVYGKVDEWSHSNLDMVIYNLNKRFAGVFGKDSKIVEKVVGGDGVKTLVRFVR